MQASQTTHGDCSPIISGDKNTITITCQDRKLLDFIKDLVTRIASKQLDPEVVYSKFDDILQGISDIRDAYAPRRLSSEQKKVLIQSLSPFKGNSVDIICLIGDSESFRYAEDFVSVFRAAGWDAGANTGINQAVFSGVPEGVMVKVVSEAETHTPILEAFGKGLSMIGIRAVGIFAPGAKKPFELIVGRKPTN
jgi:hypothetical protein